MAQRIKTLKQNCHIFQGIAGCALGAVVDASLWVVLVDTAFGGLSFVVFFGRQARRLRQLLRGPYSQPELRGGMRTVFAT
jgi:hypothetical protein